jgi:uncharacterized membrane protein
MGRDDATFIFAGAYQSEADAQLDYEVIKELHAAGVIGGYDAAVIHKGADGKVHVNKDETSTRKGAWGGAVVGAVVGILFPPSIIAGAAIGALAGGVGGHIFKGMSRSDMKDLGELLDEGQAGLLVVGDWQLEEAVDKAFAHAERTIEREIKGLERAEIEAEYAKVMSGQ